MLVLGLVGQAADLDGKKGEVLVDSRLRDSDGAVIDRVIELGLHHGGQRQQ